VNPRFIFRCSARTFWSVGIWATFLDLANFFWSWPKTWWMNAEHSSCSSSRAPGATWAQRGWHSLVLSGVQVLQFSTPQRNALLFWHPRSSTPAARQQNGCLWIPWIVQACLHTGMPVLVLHVPLSRICNVCWPCGRRRGTRLLVHAAAIRCVAGPTLSA
jgi:hypothetical protein